MSFWHHITPEIIDALYQEQENAVALKRSAEALNKIETIVYQKQMKILEQNDTISDLKQQLKDLDLQLRGKNKRISQLKQEIDEDQLLAKLKEAENRNTELEQIIDEKDKLINDPPLVHDNDDESKSNMSRVNDVIIEDHDKECQCQHWIL